MDTDEQGYRSGKRNGAREGADGRKPQRPLDDSDPEPKPPWFGCLRRYARGKRHDMAAIRKSIAGGRKRRKP